MTYQQCNTSRKIINPKSNAPAVYIPNWLIQVPSEFLSFGAKILYGRLAQWCNERGIVYRSAPQLSMEIGTNTRQVERHIKELKDVGLIGTYHKQAGGMNHYEFYDHPWMHEPINPCLIYKNDHDPSGNSGQGTPPTNMSVPPRQIVGTPPTNPADINIKEIKIKNIPPISPNEAEEKPKISPAASGKFICLSDLLKSNTYDIPSQFLEDWLAIRKAKRSPLTQSAWEHTLGVMDKLKGFGLDPVECFKTMVASGWVGMQVSYFQRDIDSAKKKTFELNELQTRERERKARDEKYEEISAAPRAMTAITRKLDTMTSHVAEQQKKLGLSAREYAMRLLKGEISEPLPV